MKAEIIKVTPLLHSGKGHSQTFTDDFNASIVAMAQHVKQAKHIKFVVVSNLNPHPESP